MHLFTGCTLTFCWLYLSISLVAPLYCAGCAGHSLHPCTVLVVLSYFNGYTLALCWLNLPISLVAPYIVLVVLTYFAGCTLYCAGCTGHWLHPYIVLVVLTYFTGCTLILCWLYLPISLVAPLHCAGCTYLFHWLHPCTVLVVPTYFTSCTLADLRTLSQGVDTVYVNFGSSGDIWKDKDKWK